MTTPTTDPIPTADPVRTADPIPTTITPPRTAELTILAAERIPLARVYRFEAVKLVAQWRVRLLVLACWLLPGLFVAAVAQQGTLPSDTLFGRWMHATGWAGPLVVLGFAGSWALPLLVSVVAGDVFAAEDRLGTWRHLLVTVRSPQRIFAAKALATATVLAVLVAGLAASGILGGLLAVGNRPLPGLDGHQLAPGEAAGAVLLAWLCALAPTLALAAIGLLGSVLLGRSPMGLLLPALVAVAVQVAQLLPLPVELRLALPGYAYVSWHGLFTAPARPEELLISVVVSLAWAAVATMAARRLFVRRDFTTGSEDGAGRRALTLGVLPLAGLLALTVAAVAAAEPASGTGLTQAKVQRAVATAFAHLYRLQTEQLHRPAVTEDQLAATAACERGDGQVDPQGAGNDWRCVVSWHLPGVAAAGQAVYQLDLAPNGQLVADGDGPKEVNGYFLVRTPTGDAPNPLWQFDAELPLL
ncbi:ABC transporter permease [Kitasatospora sp. MMS16-BH015]|uniref:ABC transporter permease n=1 Tax=Kitasatospora sp. MMS16-BH015 TaxID=2018025 RepID=UPI000CA244A6|nr:ABC transporter permease [Kitasatospora sp. MMS16-BH015]AUG76260.1 ABC transporter permease [Kitasatospora sp. MMS16-BH015]